MEEERNLKIVKRFYEAVNEGNVPAVSKLMTDDVDWKDVGAGWSPWSTWCHGREEFAQYLEAIFKALEFQAFRADEFIVGRDSVVVLGFERCLVRATGRLVEANWAQIFTLRDGSICRFREYSDTAAWRAGIAAQ
jgi:ketosteroid isomerase-like protein